MSRNPKPSRWIPPLPCSTSRPRKPPRKSAGRSSLPASPKSRSRKSPKRKRALYGRNPKLPPPRNPSRNRRSSPLRKRWKPTAGSPPSGRNPPRSRQPSRPLPNPRNPRNPRSQRPPRSRRKRRKNPGRSRGRKPPPRQRMQSPGKKAPLWRNPSRAWSAAAPTSACSCCGNTMPFAGASVMCTAVSGPGCPSCGGACALRSSAGRSTSPMRCCSPTASCTMKQPSWPPPCGIRPRKGKPAAGRPGGITAGQWPAP